MGSWGEVLVAERPCPDLAVQEEGEEGRGRERAREREERVGVGGRWREKALGGRLRRLVGSFSLSLTPPPLLPPTENNRIDPPPSFSIQTPGEAETA